jgi:4'-phosphopantetheinyl transferase
MYVVAVIDVTLMSDAVRAKALSLLSTEERGRYERFHHDMDASLFLSGRYLARHLLAHLSARQPSDISIITDGIATKPYDSGRLLEFSISHSGNYVAVAVSRQPVGIDIQVHDQTQTAIFDRFFTAEEKVYARQSSQNFYRLWTTVESLAKITGLGFNEELMMRRPRFKDAISGYMFRQTEYYARILTQTEAYTLSVVTSEEVDFLQRPDGQSASLTGIDLSELPGAVYSGSVDSDV